MTPAPDPVPVLVIGGTGRSGSTVLAGLLGRLPGAVDVGEVRYLFDRGLVQGRLCGCGQPLPRCEWWTEVLREVLGTDEGRWSDDAAHLADLLWRRTRLRALPRHVVHERAGTCLQAADELDDVLGRLYPAIARLAGARVVVDSSKLPTYVALVDGLEQVLPRVLHLVRDPRATAFSWRRSKAQPDLGPTGRMEQRGVLRSAGLWTVWNLALEVMFSARPEGYARVTYEELVADPGAVVTTALRDLGLADLLGADLLPQLLASEAPGAVRHTVAGNPARFTSAPLRLDDEWARAMRPRDRRTVEALAWPALHRYGYTAAAVADGRA